eukprot:955514-Amphidinium_carterae.1
MENRIQSPRVETTKQTCSPNLASLDFEYRTTWLSSTEDSEGAVSTAKSAQARGVKQRVDAWEKQLRQLHESGRERPDKSASSAMADSPKEECNYMPPTAVEHKRALH